MQPLSSLTRGHYFGPTTIDGNSHAQLGDSHHHYNGGIQNTGPLSVAGNMIVNNYTGYPQPYRRAATEEDPTFTLKRALYYETMETRKAQLDQVDPASFDWIWTKTSFSLWLESGTGLYWICGKPASGKSTLINHLLRDGSKKVQSHLTVNSIDPLLVHFFFDFRAGSSTANSPLGLLRSFLLQLIDKSDVIQRYLLKECGYRLEGSWPELEKELLDLVCESTKHEPRTICGFIDGLDEYNGSLLKLADLVNLLQRRSGIKLCLASRPHPELKHKLGIESFSMQSHNGATIRAYAQSALLALHEHFDQTDLESVVARIETDAGGVILWARLAVDEVVSAILRGDSLPAALRQLNDFPSELGEIYKRVLDSLNPPQKIQAAVMFFVLHFWRSSWGNTSSLKLDVHMLAMVYTWILNQLDDTQHSDFMSRDDTSRFHLKVRSMLKGLLTFTGPCDSFARPAFMHKTLDSYLRSSEEYNLFKKRIAKVVHPDTLAPVYLCRKMISADRSLHSDSGLVLSSTEYTKFARTTFRNLRNANPSRAFDRHDIAPWYLAATQTRIWRQMYTPGSVSQAHDLSRYPPSVREQYPELIHFIEYRYRRPFNLALEQHLYDDLTDEDKRTLRDLFESSQSYVERWYTKRRRKRDTV